MSEALPITENKYILFAFSLLLIMTSYGYALTNFTVSIDNEMPVLSDFGMSMGRWGQKLIRYDLFHGHVHYFTLLLGILFFALAAVRLASLFRLTGWTSFFFCGLFVTFPQLAYELVFSLMADVAGLGILLSVFCVELFLKGWTQEKMFRKLGFYAGFAFLLMFLLSIYQAFIIVPAILMVILFLQNTYADTFSLKVELKKMGVFAVVVVCGMLLYSMSVKILCPPIQDEGYLQSFVSGSSDNRFSNFFELWKQNLKGDFYYGEKTFILASIMAIALCVKFFIDRKHVVLRLLTLVAILLIPFIISIFVTNGYNPPRMYLTSNLVFAFVLVHALQRFKLINYTVTRIGIGCVFLINMFFITNLFRTVNKIYTVDKRTAERMDNIIQTKYPDFYTHEKPVYFYGYFPYDYHTKRMLPNSEIFGGSFFSWDNGSNYRIINFFNDAGVAEYQMLNTKEQLDSVKDSVQAMPIWPNYESVKLINNIVVIKLGNEKGNSLYFE